MLLKKVDFDVVYGYFKSRNFDLNLENNSETNQKYLLNFADLMSFRLFSNEPNCEKLYKDIDIIFNEFEKHNSLYDITTLLSNHKDFILEFEQAQKYYNDFNSKNEMSFTSKVLVDYIENSKRV